MNQFDSKIFYERSLPHYHPQGATLFITFRLANSLPQEVINHLKREAWLKERKLNKIVGETERIPAKTNMQKIMFGKWDQMLDQSDYGQNWLSNPKIAALVWEAITYRNNREYILEACCLMPNHVHLVITTLESNENLSLVRILQSLKGYTARKANELLQRHGPFWQHESYDHVVRSVDELERVIYYVLTNPKKAGLESEYVYSRDVYRSINDG